MTFEIKLRTEFDVPVCDGSKGIDSTMFEAVLSASLSHAPATTELVVVTLCCTSCGSSFASAVQLAMKLSNELRMLSC